MCICIFTCMKYKSLWCMQAHDWYEMHVCIYWYGRRLVYVHERACACVRVSARACVCVWVCIQAGAFNTSTRIHTHPHTLMCMCMCMLMHTAGACAGEERALTASRLVPRDLGLDNNLISGLPLGVFDALTSLR